jgi:hypothetical protein
MEPNRTHQLSYLAVTAILVAVLAGPASAAGPGTEAVAGAPTPGTMPISGPALAPPASRSADPGRVEHLVEPSLEVRGQVNTKVDFSIYRGTPRISNTMSNLSLSLTVVNHGRGPSGPTQIRLGCIGGTSIGLRCDPSHGQIVAIPPLAIGQSYSVPGIDLGTIVVQQ